MTLIEELNNKLEKANLKFIDKIIKENRINLLYQKYNLQEDKKIEDFLLKDYKEKARIEGVAAMSGCSNAELNRSYGFEIEKNYEEKFKGKGLEIISIIVD